jgi:1-acyl-sn-glycerol-3-phosphate acyltransferase
MRDSAAGSAGPWPYALACWLCRAVLEDFFDFEVYGEEHVPRVGPCLIVCNHVSFLDPPAAVVGCGRTVHSFARKTLFGRGLWRWIFTRFLTIPVDRDGAGDLGAIRSVLRLLGEGRAVLLFPEGTRSADGKMGPAKRGAGLLAAMARVPVVPARVFGSFAAFERGRRMPHLFRPVRIAYGPPLLPADYALEGPDRHRRIAELFMGRVAAVKLPGAAADGSAWE